MIAISLLVVVVIYIGLLTLALWKPPGWWKLLCVATVLAPLVYSTWDIPVGYYQYQKFCKAEAGLKIYVSNPTPAKRIRLDGSHFSSSYAEELLKARPGLEQIEAEDKKVTYSIPTAYAIYKRNADGQVVLTLVDKVGRPSGGGGTTVLEAAASHAEYILSFEREYPSLRTSRESFKLQRADGTLIGASTWLDYQWSIPSVIKTNRCGFETADYRKLLDLISTSVASNSTRK